MMFSGANPTLHQLATNKLIPFHLLKYPSYFSFVRWSTELYYLIQLDAIDQEVSTQPMKMHKYYNIVMISCTMRMVGGKQGRFWICLYVYVC
jgi:hypothetical protein